MTLFDDPTPAAPSGPLVRVRMLVAYDGSGFHGFAANAGVKTVGGTLTRSLERILRQPVELTCAGRTDTGVHAWGQVVTFDAADVPGDGLDLVAIQRALNKLCGPAIAVREIARAAPDLDARFSATGRVYRYTILNRPEPDPFLARTSWHIENPLDLDVLRLTGDPFVGEHDFATFCRRPKRSDGEEASLVRRVRRAEWHEVDDRVLRFEIEANAFCHQMVRSLVGTMVEVGQGKRRAGDLRAALVAADRTCCGQLAPPHGLCLWAVHY